MRHLACRGPRAKLAFRTPPPVKVTCLVVDQRNQVIYVVLVGDGPPLPYLVGSLRPSAPRLEALELAPKPPAPPTPAARPSTLPPVLLPTTQSGHAQHCQPELVPRSFFKLPEPGFCFLMPPGHGGVDAFLFIALLWKDLMFKKYLPLSPTLSLPLFIYNGDSPNSPVPRVSPYK